MYPEPPSMACVNPALGQGAVDIVIPVPVPPPTLVLGGFSGFRVSG